MDEAYIMTLVEKAKKMADLNFCCPHSGFTVGCCLVTADGTEYTGFNIENEGIQAICAERVTFGKALTSLEKDFRCIVVVGKPFGTKDFIKTLPCGYCRQFMNEYVPRDFPIYTYDDREQKLYRYTQAELLPECFRL